MPNGATLQTIETHPFSSEAALDGDAVIWTLPEVPAQSLLGPFVYRAALEGQASPVEVEVSWQTPSAGSAVTSILTVEEATQSEVAIEMSAGALTDIPGTGMRYFVPLGDRGQVTVARVDVEPPAGTADGLTWMGTYEVTKQNPGSLVLVVPLLQPAALYSPVHVFVDHGDGIFREQPVMGSVTGDGLCAALPVDGSSRYALFLEPEFLGDRQLDPILMKTQELEQQQVVIVEAGDIRQWVEEIDAILAVIFGSFHGGQGQQESGAWSTAAWYYRRGAHQQVGDSDNDGLSDAAENLLGTDPYNEDSDGDGDSDLIEVIFGTDPNDYHDHSIVGDCPPPLRCLQDLQSGQVFSLADSDLPLSIADLVETGLPILRSESGEPTDPAGAGLEWNVVEGAHLDASDLKGVVGVVGDLVLLFIPAGQQVQVVFGGSQTMSQPAPPPPGLETSPPPETTEPPPDTQGPTISDVVADPSEVFTGGVSLIAASVSDASGVNSVSIRWNYQGESSWREILPMTAQQKGGRNYFREIPSVGGFPQLGTVVFQVVATDNRGNTSIASGTISVVIP
jgi:hypothetical protein